MMRAVLLCTFLASATLTIAPLQAQQVESYRVIELEETVRTLNGKVEELQFQLLQLQEKLRRMEEENEGRFQEIEEKQSSITPQHDTAPQTARRNSDPVKGRTRLGKSEPSGPAKPDVKEQNTPDTSPTRGTPPRRLGTLTFDENGNVITGDVGSTPVDAKQDNTFTIPFSKGTDGAAEASEFGSTPNEVFKVAQKAYQTRDYLTASQAFGAHVKAWPKDDRTGEARYYFGQSLFWQRKYYEAAETHLEAHNEYPTSPVAAENLLALGLSLAGLNQREVACATYAEVLKQYPDAKPRLNTQVRDEQAAARC